MYLEGVRIEARIEGPAHQDIVSLTMTRRHDGWDDSQEGSIPSFNDRENKSDDNPSAEGQLKKL